ncbi:RIB43A-like with coiled-coils protein 1 [Lepisosteus oculatus]|uniref:RIB43A-like with coiled-coils protein 1 n=1 Tax=Lepisosteus oculatus TaxID=7918 RepID=UPI0035F51880
MYKVDLPVDGALAAAVERRRLAEAQRRSRVFNPRVRTLGVDLPGLERQVEERRVLEEAERRRDRAFDALSLAQDAVFVQGQQEEQETRAQLARELQEFRATQQCPKDSRDFDLNDPRAIHSDSPAGLTDPDAQYGPASMQRFEGEDPGEKERRRIQKEENERVLRAQIEERARRCQEQNHKESVSERLRLLEDLRAVQLSALEEECKRAAQTALTDYHRAQAAERAERERAERAREEQEKLAELRQQVTSDLLTEQAEAGLAGGGRVLTDRWKGMSPGQHSAILRERQEQCTERERRRAAERWTEAQWGQLQSVAARKAREEEESALERAREGREQLARYNAQLAQEQRLHQQYLEKELYTNQPTAHYFTQFNTSSR